MMSSLSSRLLRSASLFSVVVACMAIDSASRQAIGRQALEPSLTPVISAGQSEEGDSVTGYDFGRVSATDTRVVTETFVLSNKTPHMVTISRLMTSCGCTSAIILGNLTGYPYDVSPGKNLKIKVSIDIAHVSPGSVDKSAYVFLGKQASPAFTCRLVGNVDAGITFSPPIIDFGIAKAGSPSVRTLTLTSAAASFRNAPILVSTAPEVSINRGELVVSFGTPAAERTRSYRYTVTLSPLSYLGPFSGRVALQLKDLQGNLVCSELSIPVGGEVQGDIWAEPSAVTLDYERSSTRKTIRIEILGTKPVDLQGITFVCPDSYLAVKLLPSSISLRTDLVGRRNTGGPKVMVGVQISPQIPAGTLQTQMIIKTRTGQQLAVPISIWINK